MRILEHLSPAVAAIKPYEPGRPIEEVARELGLDPDSIIKLASNESPLGPSPKAVSALRAALDEVHRYPDGYAWELRQRLASHLTVSPDQLIFGNGSNEVLELVGHCFLGPGKAAVFSQYAFVVYKLVTVLFGARPIEVPATPELGHDLAAMRAAITPETTVVFLCNPNNPTSTMVSPAALEAFAASLPEGVLLVLDEAYHELMMGAQTDALAWVRAGRPVLVCRTFSKAYGLAGVRLGYGVGPAPLIRALEQARQPFNLNLLAQVAGTAALGDQEFVARNRELCRQGKAEFESACTKLKLRFIPAHANFILIEVGDGAAVAKKLQLEGVITRPMGGYGLGQYLRISFGSTEENERCLSALARVIGHDRTASLPGP
jgi:histidinol-phosphate aminotransferase